MSEVKDPAFKKINNLYAIYIASIILQFMPFGIVITFGFFLFITVFIYTYILRGKAEPEDLIDNHATYLIRTVWIFGLVALAGIVAGAFYIMYAFEPGELERLGREVIFSNDLHQTLKDYQSQYFNILLTTNIIAFGPAVIYIAYRLVKGLSRAIKGYRVASPRSFL